MHWLAFLILAVIGLTLQSALAPWMQVYGVRPDWLCATVVFLGLFARRLDAALAAWMLGFCADLMTIERPGVMALAYVGVALLVSSTREYLFCYRAVTQAAVTLAATGLLRLALCIYQHALYDHAQSFMEDAFYQVLLTAIYTALWAPVLHGILLALSRSFGVLQPRYSHMGLSPVMRKGV